MNVTNRNIYSWTLNNAVNCFTFGRFHCCNNMTHCIFSRTGYKSVLRFLQVIYVYVSESHKIRQLSLETKDALRQYYVNDRHV